MTTTITKKHVYLLTGDIGGTNSRMSLYDCSNQQPKVVFYYRNSEHIPDDKLSHPDAFPLYIVGPFLEKCWTEQPDLAPLTDQVEIVACIATAGVVANNQAKLTNLGGLLIDGNAMQNNNKHKYLKHLKRVLVINDFVAQGYGCLTLQASEVRHLYGPQVPPEQLLQGPKICVGAGTGLGECYLTQTNNQGDYTCFPSEGGHVEYAPRNNEEVKLFQYLSHKYDSQGRISVERVVSGKGLANVYDFLATTYPHKVDPTVHEEFTKAGDEQGRVVAVNAQPGTLCHQAMSIMMSAYGCEVGSAAIKWIPLGGLFVTGGLTPKNIQFIEGRETDFMQSYLHKGRVSPLLDRVPLYAVMVEDLGVRGAHKAALMEYQRVYHGPVVHEKKSLLGRECQEYLWTTVAVTAILGFLMGNACPKSFTKFK